MKHETARYVSGFDYFSAAKMTPSWCCRNSAAILAASWARLTKLAASMAIYTKLAVSMAVQAILGAFLAALGSMIMLVGLLALLCRNLAVAVEIAYQRLSANPQAAVLLQGFSLLSASNARNMRNIKSPAMRGG